MGTICSFAPDRPDVLRLSGASTTTPKGPSVLGKCTTKLFQSVTTVSSLSESRDVQESQGLVGTKLHVQKSQLRCWKDLSRVQRYRKHLHEQLCTHQRVVRSKGYRHRGKDEEVKSSPCRGKRAAAINKGRSDRTDVAQRSRIRRMAPVYRNECERRSGQLRRWRDAIDCLRRRYDRNKTLKSKVRREPPFTPHSQAGPHSSRGGR